MFNKYLIIIIVILLFLASLLFCGYRHEVKKSKRWKTNYIVNNDSLLDTRRFIELTKKEFKKLERDLYDSIKALNIKTRDIETVIKWRTNYVISDTVHDTLYIKDFTNTDFRQYTYDDDCIYFSQDIIWSKNSISTYDIGYNAENIYLAFRQRPTSIFLKREVRWFWKKKQAFVKIQTNCGKISIEKIIKIQK
jgi:hypothetical protein